MDSLTQFVLGGAVGAVTLQSPSKKTILWAGAVATIPDLDVLLEPLYADGNFVVVHRSFSHSILCTLLLSGILAKFTLKKHPFWKSFQFYFLVLFTHALLDCCTTYGTQLFWPFDRRLISFNNIHVFEPIYTLLLSIPLGIVFFSKKTVPRKLAWLYLGLTLSTSYLAWTFVSKHIAKTVIVENLAQQKITYDKLLLTPTPFNSILWKAIVKRKDTYYFGSYALSDGKRSINFYELQHQPELLTNIKDYCDTQTMLRHCDGFPFVVGDTNKISIYAVKFGPANYAHPPEFILPFQATRLPLTNDYEFKIVDNRFEQRTAKSYNQELFERIFSP
ncbi:MAG: metal-dependent hydrolase [Bacteroidota bacterium]